MQNLKPYLICLCLFIGHYANAIIAVTGIQHVITEPDNTSINCLGAIDLTAEGTAGPFTFAWSNGAQSEDISGLCANTYTVTVTNAFGCSKILSAEVKTCQEPTGSFEISEHQLIPVSPVTHTGGGVNLTMEPQGDDYFFVWTNAQNKIVSAQQNLTNMPPGTYCVRITNGCTQDMVVNECYTLDACSYAVPGGAFQLSYNIVNACPKTANGSVDLTVSGVTLPLSYQWSTGSTAEDLSNAAPGTYRIKVTDGYGCFYSELVTVAPEIANLDQVFIKHVCSPSSLGSLTIEAQPVQNYQFAWSNGIHTTGNTSTISNLQTGQYCVTATDPASACTLSKCWTIGNGIPEEAVFLRHFDHTRCPYEEDRCTGALTLQVDGDLTTGASGSTPFYSYTWAMPGGSTQVTTNPAILDLCKGDYTVTVSDNEGCSVVKNYTICCCGEQDLLCFGPISGESNPNSFSVSGPNPGNNFKGSITCHVGWSYGPVTFIWYKEGDPNFIEYTSSISNLDPGTYCAHITNGCNKETKCFTLEANMTDIKIKPTCKGGDNGEITIRISPFFEPPFSISWQGGSAITAPFISSYTIKNLAAGQYNISITDANNLTAIVDATIIESDDGLVQPLSIFNELYSNPFSLKNSCMEQSLGFYLVKPKIKWNNDFSPYAGVFSSGTPEIHDLIITWPDNSSTSTVRVEGPGEGGNDAYIISGPDDFEVTVADVYKIRITDENGCFADLCYKFSDRAVEIPIQAQVNPVVLAGTNFSLNAYTSCLGCTTECGGRVDCAVEQTKCSDYTDVEKFKIDPNDDAHPCTSGGYLMLECVSAPGNKIAIPSNVAVEEFIDYAHPLPVQNEGECRYPFGCLFLHPFSTPGINIFEDDIPIYVEGVAKIYNENCNLPDIPPSPIECDGYTTYELLEPSTCTGIRICAGITGVSFSEISVLTELITQCTAPGADGKCIVRTLCSIATPEEQLMYEEEFDGPCDETFPNTPICDVARPSASRSDSTANAVLNNPILGSLTIFPIPFSDRVYLKFTAAAAGVANIVITDLAGRQVTQLSVDAKEGENAISLNIGNTLPPGAYMLVLTKPDHTRSVGKLLKKAD